MHWRLLALPLVLSCTATRVVPLASAPYEPRPADHPIRLFSSQLPTCPFDEIAIVSARREFNLVSTAAVTEALRKKARELGGDALVRVSFLEGDAVLSGTVIRFKDGSCAH
jgi:hypothetical protein